MAFCTCIVECGVSQSGPNILMRFRLKRTHVSGAIAVRIDMETQATAYAYFMCTYFRFELKCHKI